MTKTTFSNGTIVTAAFLNAINNPVFVDAPDDDGEIAKISNSDLSTASGQILPEWTTFRDTLKVTEGAAAGSVNYTAGVVTLTDGTIQAIQSGTIAGLAGTATHFIFVNDSGVVTSSTTRPTIGLVMAAVATSNGVVGAITDLRPRFEVKPRQEAVRVFGGNGDQGAGPSTTQTLSQGLYYYSEWTVPAGVTITIDKFAQIYVSGDVTINGTIQVNQATPGPGTFFTFNDGGGFSGLPGAGLGNTRNSYPFFVQPFGSAGQNGFMGLMGVSGNARPGAGGPGGGGLWIEAAGKIVISNTAIVRAIGGQGGHAGWQSGEAVASGGGGGSGGTLVFYSLESIQIANGAVVQVRGGDGGNADIGFVPDVVVCGGAGGAGGQVVFTAPVIQNLASSPAINVTGGTAGLHQASETDPRTAVNVGGGIGGGNGNLGGFGSTILQSPTTTYSQLNAENGSNGIIIFRQIKAIA